MKKSTLKNDILTASYKVEVSKMPRLLCTGCSKPMEIEILPTHDPDKSNPRALIGSAICRHCNTGTGFKLENNTIVYVSGKSSYGNLSAKLPDATKVLYAEAELCFQSGAADASAAMCRASTEIALTKAGIYSK